MAGTADTLFWLMNDCFDRRINQGKAMTLMALLRSRLPARFFAQAGGFGLANPLENGCFELLREFLLDRSFNLAFSRRKTSTCSRNSEISLKGKDNFFRRYN